MVTARRGLAITRREHWRRNVKAYAGGRVLRSQYCLCVYVCVSKWVIMSYPSKAHLPVQSVAPVTSGANSIWYPFYFPTPVQSLAPISRSLQVPQAMAR